MSEIITKEITVKRQKTVTEKQTYNFPVYTKFYCMDSIIYIKTFDDSSYIEISLTHRGISDSGAEIREQAEIEFGSGWDWLPHDGVILIKEKEFNEAVCSIKCKLERALI